MSLSRLSDHVLGVAAKRLSAVEADRAASNQHEFNGVSALKVLFGKDRLEALPTRFLYLGEEEDFRISAPGTLTWYDAREMHATRTEYRLYFTDNAVMGLAEEGDYLVVAKLKDGTFVVVLAKGGSTEESQLRWLFGLTSTDLGFEVRPTQNERSTDMASRFILGEIGVLVETADETYLDRILDRFGGSFPKSVEFSAFARETLGAEADADDDTLLSQWLEREQMLFETLENHLVSSKLVGGFNDVDDFLVYAKSTLNRRNTRAGLALENHIEFLIRRRGARYKRNGVTEQKKRPDFLFPGQDEYHDPAFPAEQLTMLATKSTCKDRWRQVISEAERIETKHLLTLEPSISSNQTEEMKASRIRLVLPQSLHTTYSAEQQKWLLSVTDFLELVEAKDRS